MTEKYYARLLLEGDRDDGMSADDLASAFRRDYFASLLAATMKGTADMLITAGLPFHKKNAIHHQLWRLPDHRLLFRRRGQQF